jgi:hydroxypyruvate isomerase
VLRFSANLSMLYPEHGFLDRFAAAAKDGFTGVEYVGAYDQPPETIAALLRQHGLAQALFNMPAGNWAGGERGIGALPDRVDEFMQGVEDSLRYAKATDCGQVNCLAGIPNGVEAKAAEETLVANLKYAAPRFADAGVKLLLEPINPGDIPGFFVNSSAHALRIFDAVGSDNLYLQYDFYHMQRVQGELVANFEKLQSRIAHVQIADNPGRHEPGTGEINHPFIFGELERLGYDGWVGAEYKPAAGTSDGLGWMQNYLKAAK